MSTNLITLSDKIITFNDDEFVINQTTSGIQTDLVVKALSTNVFASIWSDWDTDTTPRLIGRILDPNNSDTREFVIESDYRESGSNHSISVYNKGFAVSYSTVANTSKSITKFFDNSGQIIEEIISESQNDFTLAELQEIYESPDLEKFDQPSESNTIYQSTDGFIILDQSNYRLVDNNEFYFNVSTEGISDTTVNLDIIESIREWDDSLDDWKFTPTVIDSIRIDQFSKSDLELLAETDSYFEYILEYRPDYPYKWDANAISSQNTILMTWTVTPQDGDREGLVGRFATINSRPEISQILFKEGDDGYLREDYNGVNFDGMPPFENFLYDTNRLFADISQIVDADGMPTNVEDYTFEWFILPNSTPALVSRGDTDYRWGEPLIGETGHFYDIRQEDVGKYIHARVSYTDLNGTEEKVYSVSHKVRNADDPTTGLVRIDGDYRIGSTVSLTKKLTDPEGHAPEKDKIFWYVDDELVVSETTASFFLEEEYEEKVLRAEVIATDVNGNEYTIQSENSLSISRYSHDNMFDPEISVLENIFSEHYFYDALNLRSFSSFENDIIPSNVNFFSFEVNDLDSQNLTIELSFSDSEKSDFLELVQLHENSYGLETKTSIDAFEFHGSELDIIVSDGERVTVEKIIFQSALDKPTEQGYVGRKGDFNYSYGGADRIELYNSEGWQTVTFLEEENFQLWSHQYIAKCVDSISPVDGINASQIFIGTQQEYNLGGRVQYTAQILGSWQSSDVTWVNLLDKPSAFFLDDMYSASYETVILGEDRSDSSDHAQRINGTDVRVLGSSGDDIIDFTSDRFYLPKETSLMGRDGDDILLGSVVNDYIIGGLGNDTIFSNGGDDKIEGGGGSDIFQFTRTSGSNRILDFEKSKDIIQFFYEKESNFDLGNDVRSYHDPENQLRLIVEWDSNGDDIFDNSDVSITLEGDNSIDFNSLNIITTEIL